MAIEATPIADSSLPNQSCDSSTTLEQVANGAGRGKILVVDASAANRQSVRSSLANLEYEVIEANNTSEAIAALSIERIDLVMIDLLVPEIGGTELCLLLKKANATQFLPVFVLSSSDDLEAEIRAIEAGADEFLVGPLRGRALCARVQSSLRHKEMIDSLDQSEIVLFSLAQSIEDRDPELGEHCERLAFMAAAMGVALALPPNDILALQRGGYLHDVGKVSIPDAVLFKPGPLTPEEWDIMKTHAERGERICSRLRSLAPVLPIIRHHHERWDGSGYPDGLKGEQIPLLARILQTVDIYDALTTSRPYKRAMPPDDAIAIIRAEAQRGWRDPRMVELFTDLLPFFRHPSPADFSRFSLQALAASLERFRKPAQAPSRSSPAGLSKQFQLVSGL